MYDYTASRAVQEERYLRQVKERRSDAEAPSDGPGLRKLLAMVAAYRFMNRWRSRDVSGRPF